MKKSRLLFICKKRSDYYGSFGLINSAKFTADYLRSKGTHARAIEVIDNNCIEKEVVRHDASHIIIEALWVVPDKIKLLSDKYPQKKWIVRIHSQVPFLANEGIAIEWLKKYYNLSLENKNIIIAFNHPNSCRDFKVLFPNNSYFLPNLYIHHDFPEKTTDIIKNTIDIGCFGAIRPMKNHLAQAMAAMKFANKKGKSLNFHINASRIEQKGEQTLKNLRNLFEGTIHNLVEHPWMSHSKFINLVKTMDIGMQVSLSETFNIVSADFVYCDIPVVVSSEIYWMPWWAKCQSTNINSIYNTIKLVYFFRNCCFINKYYLNYYNWVSYRQWEKQFNLFSLG